MQKHHHLLTVGGQIGGAAHDQRGGQQAHLVGRHMGMHPVGAHQRGEIIAAGLAKCQHRVGVRHPILRIGWQLAVPMDDGFHIQIIAQINQETFAGVQNQPRAAGAIDQAENRGCATVNVNRSGSGAQGQRCALRPGGKKGCAAERGRGCQKAAAGKSMGHVVSPFAPMGHHSTRVRCRSSTIFTG